jgi:rubrerythrin
MKTFGSVDDVLDFAISEEEGANRFYLDLAKRAEKPWMKKAFEDFAQEEAGHKARLLSVKKGASLVPAAAKVVDLKLSDYLTDVEPRPGMGYREALVVAMKKEKAAFKLYTDLAASTDDKRLQDAFRALASEEANHKLRFETEYDDVVLKDG